MKGVISVFGSSAPKEGSVDYENARAVGRLVAQAGYAVATGGYSGTMTAVSQGASEVGGHVIGVTCRQIEQYRGFGPNQWVKEEVKFETLTDRLLHLVRHNDGMITLPGGIGTISEMTLAWSYLQTGEIDLRPFALLGEIWPNTVNSFFDPAYVKAKDMDLLYFADSPETAVAHVTKIGD